MKLTVLGKYGPYPAANGGTSSYLVQGENTIVALDFGSGAMGRLSSVCDITALDAIVLSHLHYDHMCDLLPLSYFLKARNMRMRLVMPDTDCFQRKIISDLDGFDVDVVKPEMRVGGLMLAFEKMRHPLESFAVRVSEAGKTLFYSGDTAFCDELARFARGSSLMLLDCGKAENATAPHLSISEAAYLAKSLGIPAIASHLNPALSYVSASEFVTVAQEGKTYTV